MNLTPKTKAPPKAVYVAKVRLTYKAGAVLADVGDTCEKVPSGSLVWLHEQGLIEPQYRLLRVEELPDGDVEGMIFDE